MGLAGIFLVSIDDVFAQQSPEDCGPNQVYQQGVCKDIDEDSGTATISVETDRDSYNEGDTIKIFGTGEPAIIVDKFLKGIPEPVGTEVKNPITVQIFASTGNLAEILQLNPDENGVFSTVVGAQGAQWKDPGLYTVRATQGTNVDEVFFCFNHEGCIVPDPSIKLTVKTDMLNYELNSNAKITIHGTPFLPISVIVIDSHDKIKLQDVVALDSNGNKDHTISLFEFESGGYTLVIDDGFQQASASFSIGLQTEPEPVPSGSVIFKNPRILDSFDNLITTASVGQIVTFTSVIENQQESTELPFAFAIIVKNNQEIVQNELWITGSLAPAQLFEPRLTWEIAAPVNYVFSFELWNNAVDRDLLAEPFTLPITVEGAPEPGDDQIPPELLMPADMIITGNDPDGTVITYSVKAIDNFDQILIPTCDPPSGSTFPLGITVVRCTVTDSSGNTDQDAFKVLVEFSEFVVPKWVKDVAGFWCNDEIDDSSFVQAIQYLITTEVITVPTIESVEGISEEIPDWIKNTACWWSQGLITDGDFVNGIQFLIENGIIHV